MPLKTLLHSLLMLFILLGALAQPGNAQGPVITGISSYASDVNSTIVITGQNFSTTLSANRVFFGTVEGTVHSASATELQVQVPAGISCDVIRVNVNGLVCYSLKRFTTRFPGSGAIDRSTFATAEELPQADNSYMTQQLADIDGDGKLDILQWREGRPGFLISRNTSDFATGTISFTGPTLIASGMYPYNLQVEDMDGDGKPEILLLQNSRSNPGNFISILKNISTAGDLSASSFSQEVNIPTIADPLEMGIADFDLDGKPDVFVRTFLPAVAVHKNVTAFGVIDGSTLSPPVEFSIPKWASLALIGDLTSDGKPEIVLDIVSSPSSKAIFLKNDCSPGQPFTTNSFSFVVPEGEGPEFIRDLLDINGDNKLDVLSFSKFYPNLTAGNLTFGPLTIFLEQASGVSKIWNDFDGDGLLDALHSGLNNEALASRARNSNAAFSLPVDLEFEHNPFGKSSGDLNGDGKPDLIFRANINGQSVLFVTANKNEPLPDPTITSITPSSVIPGSIVRITGENFGASYINNTVTLNGHPLDVVAGSSTSLDVIIRHPASAGFITVRVNDVKSVTSTQLLTIAGAPVVQSIEPKVAPANTPVVITGENFSSTINENLVLFGTVSAQVTEASEGRLVVNVPAGASYGPVSVNVGGYTGKSTDPFTLSYPQGKPLDQHTFTQFTLPSTPASFPVNALRVADFDADGKTDIVVVNTNSIVVFRNISSVGSLSSSSFELAWSLPLPTTNFGQVEVGDLDGDGKSDLVLLNTYYSLSVYRNTSGQGTISFESSFSTPAILDSVIKQFVLEDVDNDGKLDIVHNIFDYDFLNYTSTHDVWVLRNVGQPGNLSLSSFESRKLLLPLDSYYASFTFSDINKDHRPDVIGIQTPDFFGHFPIAFFENNSTPGNPLIGGEAKTWNYSSTVHLTTGDLNYDGIIDIVGTNGKNIVLYSSTAPITTISTTQFSVSAINREAFRLALADMDGDGKADIVGGGNSIVVLENSANTVPLSANSFSAATFLPNRQVAVCATDLDGDGLNDIVGLGEDGIVVSHNINALVPVLYNFTPVIATEGIKVTLTGKNFSPVPSANSVKVNGTATPVIAASDSTLSVIIPAGATSGKISVEVDGKITTSLTSLTILKPQTLAFDSIPAQQFGVDYFVDLPPVVTSAGLPVQYTFSNPSVAYIWYDQIRITNAGTVTITATQAGNSEYHPLVIKRTLVVKKGISKIYFAEDSLDLGVFVDAKPFYVHPVALDYSDYYYSDLPITITSSDTRVASVTDTLVTVKNPGSAFLTFSHQGSSNYEPYSVTRELVVRAHSQTIKFDPVIVSCSSPRVFDLAASTTSGLPVTITSSNPAVASVNGKSITLKASGITDLVATQEGNKYFPAATSISRQLQVELKSQTIIFEEIPEKHLHSGDFSLVVSSSSGLPVKMTSSTPEVATVAGTIVSIHKLGEAQLVATQEGSGCFLPAEPVTRELNVNLVTDLEETIQDGIALYPNPTNGNITISIGATSNGPVSFRVFNSQGETMLTEQYFNGPEMSVEEIAFFPAGIYIVALNFNSGIVYKKFVKK